jgi:hypothetical protein
MNDENHDHDHDHAHGEWFSHGILKSRLVAKLGAAFLLVATVFIGARAINAIVNFDTISEPPSNVITVDGEGKVAASPDIASVSFTVSEDADTAAHAQDAVLKKVNVALKLLKDLKVADKDIKTSSYTVSPRYSYPQPCYSGQPCIYNQEQKIIGFTTSETVDVKVRDLDSTGKVLSALGDAGISNLYGPNFTVEDQDGLKAEARKEAITKARAKAKELAKDLGVRLVRVVSYAEGGYYPGPFYGKAETMGMGWAAPVSDAAVVPTGENEIKVNVTVTYEIR